MFLIVIILYVLDIVTAKPGTGWQKADAAVFDNNTGAIKFNGLRRGAGDPHGRAGRQGVRIYEGNYKYGGIIAFLQFQEGIPEEPETDHEARYPQQVHLERF
jgi:hypothetical protein